VNSSAVQHLVLACKMNKTKLIHFSTDYVYDSILDRPIQEADPTTPKSVYGISKRTGEEVLEESDIDWINVRVSWLYSIHRHNFVKTMMRLGQEKEQLRVVADQVGAPTYAHDLAQTVMTIIAADKGYRQHYNFSNTGSTNWADFAREIMRLTSSSCTIEDTTTEVYAAPAPRPLWSVMAHDKIKETFDLEMRSWKEALKDCVDQLS